MDINQSNAAHGYRVLFHGLCLFWGIEVFEEEDITQGYDFILPGRPRVYVVLIADPAGQAQGIAEIRSYGNQVLALDDFDLSEFRQCHNKVRAAGQLWWWVRTGDTHAARELGRLARDSG